MNRRRPPVPAMFADVALAEPRLIHSEKAGDARVTAQEASDLTSSAWNPPPPEESPALKFYTPKKLIEETPEKVDWFFDGYIGRGIITEIDGKIKSGKTTLTLQALKAIFDEEKFIGRTTKRCNAVYLTEQDKQSFRLQMVRAGINPDSDNLLILFRADMWNLTWSECIQKVTAHAIAYGYDLIVIDTISKLSRIENENDASAWSLVMTPLLEACESNIAVLVLRHSKKGTSELGESGRGSSQASGEVGIILDFKRQEGNVPNTRRVLNARGRFEGTPEEAILDLIEDRYSLLGDAETVSSADAIRSIVSYLGSSSTETNRNPGASATELEEGTGLSRRVIDRATRFMETTSNQLWRTGTGVRGNPFLFHLQNPQEQILPPEERNVSVVVLSTGGTNETKRIT